MAKRPVTQEELRRKLAEVQELQDLKKLRQEMKAHMPRRKLRIVREKPPLGICEYCDMQFSPTLTALGAPNKDSIQEQFNAHKCKREDFVQNAARIEKEATDNK